MSMEPCPQCGTQWQAGQEVCPNCGYRRPAAEARFRTGETGMRPIPSFPGQDQGAPGGGAGPSPGPPAAPPPAQPPAAPPSSLPPGPPGGAPAPGFGAGAPPPGQYPGPGAAGAPPAAGQGMWTGGTAQKTKSAIRPLAILGAIGVIAAGPLPWVQFHFETSGWNLLFKFLITGKQQDIVNDLGNPGFSIASIGVVLIVLGVIALALAFVPTAHVLRRVVGVLAIAIAVVFVLQLFVGEADETIGRLFKDLGPGVYTAFVGGILVLVG